MLTPTEERVLTFFRDYSAEQGRPPLLREIGEGLGIKSKGTVHRYIRSLVNKGYLLQGAGGWRGISLTLRNDRPLTFPLLGRVAAGRPIEAIPGQDEIDLAALLDRPGVYALKVSGDSMIGADIFDGDFVFLRRQDTAEDGAIVSALIDGEEATLKRFRRLGDDQVLLISENPTLAPMIYEARRVLIQGVLLAKLRVYRASLR